MPNEPVKKDGGKGGPGGRRPRKSRYGTQLEEKQNLKEIFGLREEQLKKYFNEARRGEKMLGPSLVTLLERRLDNAVYRAGIAETRKQARQMTTHGLFAVNGRGVNVPSLRLKKGDVVSVKEGKRRASYFTNFDKKMQSAEPPAWIKTDMKSFGFKVEGEPTLEEAKLGVDLQAIVELLSR
jgi:small subunit ribosomal protein S4